MGRLYHALSRSRKHGWSRLSITEKEEVALFRQFLKQATFKGVSINNLVFRQPTHIHRSDASLFGIGSYNLVTGKAWRFEIPEHLKLRSSLNSLEFITAMISIWIESLDNSSLTNNGTKTSFISN